jgi:hypothetical protein
MLALAETVPSRGSRLSELLDLSGQDPELIEGLRAAEQRIYGNPADPLMSWDERDLMADIRAAGFTEVDGRLERIPFRKMIREADLERWLGQGRVKPGEQAGAKPGEQAGVKPGEQAGVKPGERAGEQGRNASPSYGEQAAEFLAPGALETLRAVCRRQLQDREVEWFRAVLVVSAGKSG